MHGQPMTRLQLEASAATQRAEWRKYSTLKLFGDALARDEADCATGVHVLRAMDECGCNVLPIIDAEVQGCRTSAVVEYCIVCPNGTRWVDEPADASDEAEKGRAEMHRRRKAEFDAYKQRVADAAPSEKFIETRAVPNHHDQRGELR